MCLSRILARYVPSLPCPTSPLKVKSGVNITQYDVVVSSLSKPPKKEAAEPPRLPVARARAVVAQLIQANPNISPLKSSAFDGNKNLFTVDELPGGSGPFDFQVTVDAGTSGAEEFKVTLTHAQTLGLDVLTTFFQQKCKTEAEKQSSLFAVACLDILFRQTPATRQGWIVSAQGRKFLDTTKAENLGQGAQVLQGFFQSCRPTMAGMVMVSHHRSPAWQVVADEINKNVDSAYSPVWRSGALLEVCKAIVGKDASGGGGGSFRGGGRGGPRGRGGDRGGRGGRGGSFSGGGAPPPFTGFDAKEVKYLEMKLKGANVRVTHRSDI